MAKIKLTKSAVDTAQSQVQAVELRDTLVPGFLCKITPAGRKVFMLQYRTNAGDRRKPALGLYGELTVEQARSLAQEWLAQVRRGGDPAAGKAAARTAPTVKELCKTFMEDYSKQRNKPSTQEGYQSVIDRNIIPLTEREIDATHPLVRVAGLDAYTAAGGGSKFFSLPSSPRCCDRCAVRPAHPPPAGSQQGRTGATSFNPKGEIIMANIGTFTAEKDGFTGTLRTLTLNVKVKLVPNDKGDNDNAPDFRLQAAGHDIGAAWKKTSEAGRPYVSVTLDDPSFPATVYARLIENEDGTHGLIWSRSKPKAA
jgi:uncharacterized protein (DUF736 family)